MIIQTAQHRPLRTPLAARPQMRGPLARRLPQATRNRLHQTTRAMASRPGDEKSWGEIAGDALQLARTAVGKAASGVRDAVGKLLPRAEEPPPQQPPRFDRRPFEDVDGGAWGSAPRGRARGGDLFRPDDGLFGGGLLGRAAGSLFGGALGEMGKMMAETSRQAAGAKQRAVDMIQADAEVSAALGGDVRLMPGLDSQSSSTQIVNGRTTKRTSLAFLVAGSRGQPAQAQVELTGRPDGSEDVKVTVLLPDGRRVPVTGSRPGGGGGSGPGATIDVDWRDVS